MEVEKMLLNEIFLFYASYGVEDPQYAITQLAQTTMRSELGKYAQKFILRKVMLSFEQYVMYQIKCFCLHIQCVSKC